MSPERPIPIPMRLVWREFVARRLPIVFFVVVLFAALVFWRQRLSPATIPGEVETIQAIVNAPETGILTELAVRSFQQVRTGDILGKIVSNDPKKPALLIAPINGAVTFLHAAVGDKVQAGLPVLLVAGNKPDRIIAFLRQPISFVPAAGDPVRIRPRARHPGGARTTVQRVGLQLTPIRQTLLPLAASRQEVPHIEYGLPVIVNVPPELQLFPGEVVELTLLPKPAAQPRPVPVSIPKTNMPPQAVTNTLQAPAAPGAVK
jgi:hypothetical protein